MIRTTILFVFTTSLCVTVFLTQQYNGRTQASLDEPFVENVTARVQWDYLRLRDPATGEIPRGIHARELAFARTIGMHASALKVNSAIHTLSWKNAGPTNTGGRTRAVAIDTSEQSNILIATAQGGIFRSTDLGRNWTRTTAPSQMKDNTCLVQDHRTGKQNIWYCGTGELISTTFRRASVPPSSNHTIDIGNGIYKSIDSGKSWTILQSTVDGTGTVVDSAFDGVWNIVVDNSTTAKDIVYAATLGAIQRSTDGGATWTRVLGDRSHTSFVSDVQITSSGVLYAFLSSEVYGSGTPSTAGVWRSTDGVKWTNITPTDWPSAYRMRIAIAPSNENVVYVAGQTNSSASPAFWKYTYVSGDGSGSGGTWENRSANLPSATNGNDGINLQGGYNVTLKVYPTNPDLVYFGATNLFRSASGFREANDWDWIGGYYRPYIEGNSDSTQTYPNTHEDYHDVAFLPSFPRMMFTANDGGVFVTMDDSALASAIRPVEWQNLNHNDVAGIVYVVAIDHATPMDSTVAGGFQDQASWITTGGSSWVQRGGGDGCYCAIADNKDAYYVSSQNGNIRQYHLDVNLNVIDSAAHRPPVASEPQFITPWMLDPTNSNEMFFVSNDSLWRTSDLTPMTWHWQLLTNCTIKSGTYITALGMSTVPAHRLYYGTSDGHLYRVDGADAASPTRTEITSASFPKNAFISCVAVDPQNADSIVVCFSNYHVISIFASNDGGATWHNASGTLEEHPDGSGDGPSVRWVTIVHQNGQTLYLCGTSAGLFSATDISGANVNWMPEGLSTIGQATVENIDARQSDGFVAVATQGEGVFTTFVSTNASDVENSSIPNSHAIALYPNPAQNDVVISVSGVKSKTIRLVVVDEAGKIVSEIYRGETNAPSRYHFDSSQLPPGNYYVRLISSEATETRRLVIQR